AEGDAGSAGSGGEDGPEPRPTPTPTDVGSGERTSAVSKRGSGGSADAASTTATSDAPEPAGRETTLATPATRKVARERGVDLDDVPTDETRDGEAFVTAEAVNAYADALESPDESTPEPADVDVGAGTDATAATGAADAAGAASGDETVPYRGVRRTIGKQMERSKYTAPHVTHHDTAEVDALVEARAELKPKAEASDVKLTYMPFVMKAIVAGLKEYPYLNSELREDDEEIVLKGEYNLGIAVAT
ncbi:branched-chain alpha-keto acid dehydrogenase subunit E2, partial [Halorubrum sp. C3]